MGALHEGDIAIKHANQRIYETAQRDEEKHGMGTTIVAALFNDDRVIVAHVGDSRCYRLRRNQLIQLTEDHSLLNDYMRMKRLSGEDTGRFAQKNVIDNACDRLIRATNDAGGTDNITAILCRIERL